jgi:hypothetical protein
MYNPNLQIFDEIFHDKIIKKCVIAIQITVKPLKNTMKKHFTNFFNFCFLPRISQEILKGWQGIESFRLN